MLQSIRDRAQGWIAWFIVILISVPFALWGIQEYVGVGSEPVIAEVNQAEITEREFETRYRDYREQLRQRLGDAYQADMFDEGLLRQEALDSMIRTELLVQKAADLGMRAGDALVRASIADIPAFQINGRFSMEAYERTLRSQGLDPQGFEQRMYRGLLVDQLQGAVRDTNWVSDDELAEAIRLRGQKRSFDYLIIPASRYQEEIVVTDQQVEDYYADHTSEFIAPQQVKLDYIELNKPSISASLEVSDADLEAYYEQHREAYVVAERRRAAHILFLLEDPEDSAQREQVEQQARAVLERVQQGEDFAALAQELSQDPGSAQQGGDLGFFGRGVMDPAFEEAVFSLNEGDTSDPVASAFGIHLIRLTAIQPEAGKSFAEAEEEVRTAYLKGEAERQFFDYAERLADLAYQDPDTLVPAAEALGLEIQQSDWISRETASGLFRSPKLLAAAFSDDVLYQGHNSELIELTPEHMMVLRSIDHTEATNKLLTEVREEIVTRLQQQQAAAQVKTLGEAYLAQLQSGETSLEQLAEETEQTLNSHTEVQRAGAVPREVSNAAFRLAPPSEGSRRISGAAMASGDYLLLALTKVVDGDPSSLAEGEQEQLRRSLAQAMGQAENQHLLENLRNEAKVKIMLKQGAQ